MNLHLTPEMPDVCLSFVLLFKIFIIVVTLKLVLQQSKNVTAKCIENLSPSPCILYLLGEKKGKGLKFVFLHAKMAMPDFSRQKVFLKVFFPSKINELYTG